MINYIKGILVHKTEQAIVVEGASIGYQIFVSVNTLQKLPSTGHEVKIFTYLNVKEDGISLYGFLSMEEQNIFHLLISVSGIGPKGALGVLSIMTPQEFIFAVATENTAALSRAPGIGKKTAQRIIIDLKDKMKHTDLETEYTETAYEAGTKDNKGEAIDALMVLGYTRGEALSVVTKIIQAEGDLSTEDIIKAALSKLYK